MTWEEMVVDEEAMKQIRQDYGFVQARFESADFERVRFQYGVSYRQGHRAGFWRAVEWLRHELLKVDDLTVAEYVTELRKGPGSVFWPLWQDDPKFGATCEQCGHLIVLDKEGLCPDCGWEVQ